MPVLLVLVVVGWRRAKKKGGGAKRGMEEGTTCRGHGWREMCSVRCGSYESCAWHVDLQEMGDEDMT